MASASSSLAAMVRNARYTRCLRNGVILHRKAAKKILKIEINSEYFTVKCLDF